MLGQVGSGVGNINVVDVIERLPERGATRLQNARLRRDDAGATMRGVLDQIAEHREVKTDDESQLRLLQSLRRDSRSPALGGPAAYEETEADAALDAATRANKKLTTVLDGDPPQVVELKNKISRSFAEMARLAAAQEQRSALWNARGRLVRNIETHLVDGIPPGCSLQSLPETAAKLGKGQHILDEIEARRRRGRELAANLRDVRAASITPAAARQKMRETIEALAARGAPSVERLMFGGEIEFPQQNMQAVPVLNNDAHVLIAWQEFDAASYITWLMRDAIVAKLDAEIARESDGAPGLTDVDRANREAEIIRDALAAAREECALVELAHAQGMTSVEAREDVDPMAFLNLEMITVARAAPPSGSSPEHAGWNLRR
jgi:hypothetical protein